MARRNYYSSSNSALGGCGTILIVIIAGIMALIQWMKENPTLTIIILVGIIAIVLFIVSLFKKPTQNNSQQYNQNYNRYNYNEQNNGQQSYSNRENSYTNKDTHYNKYNYTDDEDQSFENNYEQEETNNSEYEANTNKKDFVVDIQTCTTEEILSLDGFDSIKAKRFIEERDNGKMWYDLETFVQDFGLQPHEMIMIQDRIKFPDKPKNRYGRKLDI